MKKIETWLNEKEFERFVKRAKTYDLTCYALLKILIQIEISGDPKEAVMLSKAIDLYNKK